MQHEPALNGLTIGVVGVGLIGGSIARRSTAEGARVLVWNRTEEVSRRAVSDGAADGLLTEASAGDCDAVFVCLYPALTVEWIEAHAGYFGHGALLMDVTGVKRPVCARCAASARRAGARYVSTHPMAGRERGGYEMSAASLFDGASMILIRDEWGAADERSYALARRLSAALGFGRVIETDASSHDRAIAYTSQLPHAIASAYAASARGCVDGFTGGSWRDMTRVAASDETMWSELFAANGEALVRELDELIRRLAEIRGAVLEGDAVYLAELLKMGRLALEREVKDGGIK